MFNRGTFELIQGRRDIVLGSEDDVRDVRDSLKEVMRGFPQGVTVVTAKAKGKLWGVTVSSFTTVSLDPPVVLISLMKGFATSRALSSSAAFTVNLLADDQRCISDRFAGRIPMADRFEGLRYSLDGTSSPVIEGVVGYIDCRKWREYDGGDHILILGEVAKARRLSDKAPLVYYAQQYTGVVPP
jgi:flavin reductase (DIM6/NTAB) family NADH-FMN oxidoreductase RutF